MEPAPRWYHTWLPSLHISERLLAYLLGSMVYTVSVGMVINHSSWARWTWGTEWAALSGLVLGTLLAFRNKEAYDRWWEGRKLWGQLVNDTRTLALQIRAHARVGPEEQRRMGELLHGFALALKGHLRNEQLPPALPGVQLLSPAPSHLPLHLAEEIHLTLGRWNHEGRLDGTIIPLGWTARGLMDVCGACERIRHTPVPSSYRALLRHGILVYILITPWTILMDVPLLEGVGVTAVSFYFLLGIELTAEEVEEPFGTEKDDLPLETYCDTIGGSMRQILGNASTPFVEDSPG